MPRVSTPSRRTLPAIHTGGPHARPPVLVVGGGIAGLTAAWKLQRQGVPVRVIEPGDGARIRTVSEGGGRLETGMQFYYSGYRSTFRLLRAVGLLDQLRRIEVRGAIAYDGAVEPFSKTVPWLRHLGTTENLQLQWAVARQMLAILRASPFGYGRREAADTVDVGEYFLRHGNRRILEVAARPLVNSYAFCEPEGHSLAQLLRIIKLGALYGTYGLVPGNDALPRRLAAELSIIEGRAAEIVMEDGAVRGVLLEEDARLLPAEQVVCAVPAPQAAGLLPALPEAADGLAGLFYSSVVLVNLHLDRALQGPEWIYVLSRQAGHQAAFAVDLLRRLPAMFPDGRSVLQVDFASPASDALLGRDDATIVSQALTDMATFIPDVASSCRQTSVVRRPRAMPAFACGMQGRIKALQRELAPVRGLYLAGDYLRAPLCEGAVRSGEAAARAVAKARA